MLMACLFLGGYRMQHGVVKIAWALQLLRPSLSFSSAIDLSEALLLLWVSVS